MPGRGGWMKPEIVYSKERPRATRRGWRQSYASRAVLLAPLFFPRFTSERQIHKDYTRLANVCLQPHLLHYFPPQHGSLHINCLSPSIHWKNQPGCNKWRLQCRISIDEFSVVCWNSLAASIKQLTEFQLALFKCVPIFKSPYHTFSPLYRFLLALGRR